MTRLSAADFLMFAGFGVDAGLLERTGVVRVTDDEARLTWGFNGSGDNSGIIFPYLDPVTGVRHTCRLRRDFPDIEDGKPKGKYLSPYADRRSLYLVPGCSDSLADASVSVVLVEAEKSALALTGLSERKCLGLLPVAMGGAWGFRGRIGKIDGPNGERLDEKGPLPELASLCFSDRKVIVMLDANSNTNSDVRRARTALVRELNSYGARPYIATIPAIGDVNGPDDLLAQSGDAALEAVLELARPALEVAIDDAETAVEAVVNASKFDSGLVRQALDCIAEIPDQLQRLCFEGRLAEATRGIVPKKVLGTELRERLRNRNEKQADFSKETREAELRRHSLDLAKLIIDLENFFAARAYLPEGAALLLAFFTLNTHLFDVYDSTPYLSLESAVPGCGKSTILRLLKILCCRPQSATAMSEAVLFRLIDQTRPTLLIDEAETIEGKSERAESIRAIAHEGYKKGGQVPRCEGENHEVRWFDVYCPKVFAAIGGLSGALLERCLPIHMSKAPRHSTRKSTRARALERDAKALLSDLEAYAVQAHEVLEKLYDAEPDEGYWPSITDREAELWGPLLMHAKLAGPAIEERLLAVVGIFAGEKIAIRLVRRELQRLLRCLRRLRPYPAMQLNSR